MNEKINAIIGVYAQEGYTITREEAESINEAIEFAYETWKNNK